jgi:hypothetical protein
MYIRPSVCTVLSSACISAASTGWISVKFDIGNFYENLSRKSKSVKHLAQILSGTLDWKSKYVLLLPATKLRHRIIVVQFLFLSSWQRIVAQMHREGIAAFISKKCLRECTKTLLCTYTAYLILYMWRTWRSNVKGPDFEPDSIFCSYIRRLFYLCNSLGSAAGLVP